MNADASLTPTQRLTTMAGVGLFMVVAGFAGLVLRLRLYMEPVFMELILYTLLGFAICCHARLRGLAASLPRPGLAALLLLVGLTLTGQIANRPGDTFPFVNWTMYTRPVDIPVTHHVLAHHQDGSVSPLIQPGMAVRERSFLGHVHQRYHKALEAAGDGEADFSDYEALVAALVAMRSGRNRNNPIMAVSLHRTTINGTDWRPGLPLPKEQLHHLDLGR
ncbi:MAG: hypothetical protein EA425_00785 [Puniceicoccaceae bacterium]|nr:MAG: hypothetical protein EA425_00785 [Puniceicoccaceae bacterium]